MFYSSEILHVIPLKNTKILRQVRTTLTYVSFGHGAAVQIPGNVTSFLKEKTPASKCMPNC